MKAKDTVMRGWISISGTQWIFTEEGKKEHYFVIFRDTRVLHADRDNLCIAIVHALDVKSTSGVQYVSILSLH